LREAVANEFAAHVLMPTHLVKEHWFKTPDLLLLATAFNVSGEAIKRRLEKMGLIGEPTPRPRKYFRHVALIDTDRPTSTACATQSALLVP
jgi:Zn-dependent peptidase ImmA (M78 family)